MRIKEMVLLVLLMVVSLGGLALPLWWDRAQPFIFGLPGYIEGVIGGMKDSIDYILKNV